MKLAAVALLIACTACRISTNKWGGAPPRRTNAVRIMLHGDKDGVALAQKILSSDTRVSITDFPEDRPLEDACAWARSNGADYYAVAYLGAAYDKKSECTHYSSDFWDVKHETCVRSRVTWEGAHGEFRLGIYDVADCKMIPSLSEQVGQYTEGNETESPIEAQMAVTQMAPQHFKGFPDQSTITADGHVENAAGDGQYALFHFGVFQGIASLHHAGEPNEHLHMLMCCEEPVPGDFLVKRGPMKFYELLLSFDGGIMERRAAHLAALGAGIHIRRSPLESGLQVGISADALGAEGKAGAGLFSLEVGWGLQVAPAWHISANADFGLASLTDTDADVTEVNPFAFPNVRALFGVKWFYAGLDVGYAISSATETGVRMRGVLGRLTAAVSL